MKYACAGSVVLLVVCFSPLGFLRAEEKLAVSVQLKEDERFVGEVPRLRIIMTATGEGIHRVRNQDDLIGGGGLACDLVGPNEKLRNIQVRYAPRPGGSRFAELHSGKTIEYEIPVLARPSTPGDFRLSCRLRPLVSNERFLIEKEFMIRFVHIPETLIHDKTEVDVPGQVGFTRPFRGKLQLLNVKTKAGNELIFQKIDKRDEPVSYYLRSVLQLDEDSKLVAVPMFFDQRDRLGEIWVAYSKGDEGFIARLEFSTGSVLEILNMKQAFEQFNQPK